MHIWYTCATQCSFSRGEFAGRRKRHFASETRLVMRHKLQWLVCYQSIADARMFLRVKRTRYDNHAVLHPALAISVRGRDSHLHSPASFRGKEEVLLMQWRKYSTWGSSEANSREQEINTARLVAEDVRLTLERNDFGNRQPAHARRLTGQRQSRGAGV